MTSSDWEKAFDNKFTKDINEDGSYLCVVAKPEEVKDFIKKQLSIATATLLDEFNEIIGKGIYDPATREIAEFASQVGLVPLELASITDWKIAVEKIRQSERVRVIEEIIKYFAEDIEEEDKWILLALDQLKDKEKG